MFTNFNRILLASGLALTSLVGFSSTAFAQDTAGQTLTGEANPVTEITWTEGSGAFTQAFNYGATVDNADVGTVAYVTNIIGSWDIKASSGNAGADAGKLVGVTENTVALPYALKLGTGGTYAQPLTAGASLRNGAVTTAPVDTSDTLFMQVGNGTTATQLKVVAQNYTDTVTLTFTSGGI